MNPLYSVGEEVILQSNGFPELNGECEVLEVEGPTTFRSVSSGAIRHGYAYIVTTDNPRGAYWSESSLRKKYTPGDSFNAIIRFLKHPNGVDTKG